MGFGHKKEKKQEKEQSKKEKRKSKQHPVERIKGGENVLYPPREQSAVQEVLIALGCAAVALILVVVIVQKKSMINQPYNYNNSMGNRTVQQSQPAGEPDMADADKGDNTTDNEPVIQEEVRIVEESAFVDPGELEERIEENQGVGTENRDYIIMGSESRLISAAEIDALNQQELSFARNEIYARHGRLFKDESLQSYFNSKDWYRGSISPDAFSESILNEYEKKNLETIISVEQKKGYR